MTDGDVVANVDVIRHYAIREHTIDGEKVYDWHDYQGDDSDEWFQSIEEAIADIKGR